jgi:ERCC4-type nuclease
MGDFQVVKRETSEPYLIMERKTVQDVKASVIDGRYREQKDKLLCLRKEHPTTRLCYVLEGKQSFNPLEKMSNGVVTNTIIRDQIPSFFTRNQEETWDLLWDIFQRISKDEEMFKRSYNFAPFIRTHMESVSKTCVTPKKSQNVDTFVLQLSCIEGVGTRKAYDIIHTFNVKYMNKVCRLTI